MEGQKMLQVITHQKELFRVFKHPFLSYVFMMKTWKSNNYLSQCCAGNPKLTIMLLMPGCCHKYNSNAVTEWVAATNRRSASSQKTSDEYWWRQIAGRATWHRALLHNTRARQPSGCPSQRMGQGSSSSPPCTVMLCFLVINWFEA